MCRRILKSYLIAPLFGLVPLLSFGQSSDSTGAFGFALNSGMNGELYPYRIVPSVVYSMKTSQFELGLGFNPFYRDSERLLSSEFNYKYFPNATVNKFNLYFLVNFSYIRRSLESFFPTTYNYLFVNGGYGLEIRQGQNLFWGTNVSYGVFTFNKKSEIPVEAFSSQRIFDEFGSNLAFQLSIRYRLKSK